MRRRDFILGAVAVTGAAAVGGGAAYMRTPQFGRAPSAARLKRMMSSPNWSDGAFQNYEPLEIPPPGKREGRLKIWWKFLFADREILSPEHTLPFVPLELDSARGRDFAVWLGHSSVYMELDGMRILIDPVFSPYASPVPFINRAFPGTTFCSAADFPQIDLLAISHDHWDHLDYPTVTALLPKVSRVVCPLGVGEYLEQWGFAAEKVMEGDWFDSFSIGSGIKVHLTPSRHFSGRLAQPNQALWCGFVFEGAATRVYFSGDGGWGRHFGEIARRFAPFDFAFLENGQYNDRWPSVHMAPPETALAAKTIRAEAVIPIHNSRFALSRHAWDAPLKSLLDESQGGGYRLLTPKMGEIIDFESKTQTFPPWFNELSVPDNAERHVLGRKTPTFCKRAV